MGFGLGFQELLLVGIVALLLFGKRLPEVARSLGKSYREFRKGLADIQSSIDYDDSSYYPTTSTHDASPSEDEFSYDDDEPTAPKFEPPPAPPQPAATIEPVSSESPPSDQIAKPIEEK